jgi:hypothetical protein
MLEIDEFSVFFGSAQLKPKLKPSVKISEKTKMISSCRHNKYVIISCFTRRLPFMCASWSDRYIEHEIKGHWFAQVIVRDW